MQLFITPYIYQANSVLLIEERVVFQCNKVLRYTIGSQCVVQWDSTRIYIRITQLTKKEIVGEVIETIQLNKPTYTTTLAIALPNKYDKLDLIVQKCSEIGIQHIVLRNAFRSQVRTVPSKKIERLQTIILEAAEQSWSSFVPSLTVQTLPIAADIANTTYIIFDQQDGVRASPQQISREQAHLYGIIGPEGGLDVYDYQHITVPYMIHGLGTAVLRMETAAIIAAWRLVNTFS